jgi:hypothetical protein
MRTLIVVLLAMIPVVVSFVHHQQPVTQPQAKEQEPIVLGSDGRSSWGLLSESTNDRSLKRISLVEDQEGRGLELLFHGNLDGRILRTLVIYSPVAEHRDVMQVVVDFGADGSPELRYRGPGLHNLHNLARAPVNSAQATLGENDGWVDVEVHTRHAGDGTFVISRDGTTYIFSWKDMRWRKTSELLDAKP